MNAHILVYHSTLGLRVIKKKKNGPTGEADERAGGGGPGVEGVAFYHAV